MALNSDPFFPASIKSTGVKIVPADTTTLKTLWTAGANGSKVTAVGASSDSSATEVVQLWFNNGTIDILLGTKQLAISAGFITGTPAFNWFDGVQIPWLPIDKDGQRYLILPAGGLLKVAATVTITAAKTIYHTAIGTDF